MVATLHLDSQTDPLIWGSHVARNVYERQVSSAAMTESDLRKMEAHLEVTLPEQYRRWALMLPPPNHEEESWQFAFGDCDALIEENRRLRADGWYGLTWHNHLVCVGAFEGITTSST